MPGFILRRALSRRFSPVAFALGVLLSACGDAGPTEPATPPRVATVDVVPGDTALIVGQTLRFGAVPRSADGTALRDRFVAWRSEDPALATITNDGHLLTLAEGRATIIATSEGVEEAVTLDIVPIPAHSIAVELLDGTLLEGEQVQVTVVLRDSLDRELTGRLITWTSDRPLVATVSAAGIVTAIGEGRAVITARHAELEASVPVDVRSDLGAEVLFDVNDGAAGTPRLYRVDLRPDAAVPTAVFGIPGTWQASVSPDGQRLAFTCTSDGPAICTSARDGSDVRALTSGGAYEDQPAWSPDGTRIAFRRWPQGGTPGPVNPTDVWVMQADGSGQVNITADAPSQHTPAWSPRQADGSYRLVYAEELVQDGFLVSHLVSRRADGADRRVHTALDLRTDEHPTWSPDGRTIVFVRSDATVLGDLWALDVASGETRPLLAVALDGTQRSPEWSPDGRHLVFTSAHEPSEGIVYREQLYTVRADGSQLRKRTNDGLAKENPTWQPRP